MINYKGSGILFVSENKYNELEFFLCKRNYRPVCWSIPGGGYDDTDGNLLNAAIRESWEEIGVILNDDKSYYREFNFNIPFFYNWSTFVVKVKKKKFNKNYKILTEFSDGKWFKEIPKDTHFLLPRIIRQIQKDFTTMKTMDVHTDLKENEFKLFSNVIRPRNKTLFNFIKNSSMNNFEKIRDLKNHLIAQIKKECKFINEDKITLNRVFHIEVENNKYAVSDIIEGDRLKVRNSRNGTQIIYLSDITDLYTLANILDELERRKFIITNR